MHSANADREVCSPMEELESRALTALLAMQRHSWEQGVTSHALIDLGRGEELRVLARDAVQRQTADGRLGELEPLSLLNGAALAEAVLRLAGTGDEKARSAHARQLEWLLRTAPRAGDGTLFHVAGTEEVWVDTVYMVLPPLVAAGHAGEALRQLDGHRRRLFDPTAGLYAHIWDDRTGTARRKALWASGNGWVVAGIARALTLLDENGTDGTGEDGERFRGEAGRHARAVLDAVLTHLCPATGLPYDVLDDGSSFTDPAAALMFAYAAFSGVREGWLPQGYLDAGESLWQAAAGRVDDDGVLAGACASPHFDRPGHSPEAQAFLLLAASARRRACLAG